MKEVPFSLFHPPLHVVGVARLFRQVDGGVPAMTSGIYAGWASKGDDPTVYPTALSVGWNPHFHAEDKAKMTAQASGCHGVTASHSSTGKTLEPWLLHDFGPVGSGGDGTGDFYGEELRLVVVGYIRPEAPFTTVEALVERIHQVKVNLLLPREREREREREMSTGVAVTPPSHSC